MELLGNVLGHGVATSAAGRAVSYRVRDVTPGTYNAIILGRELEFWQNHYDLIGRAHLQGKVEYQVTERAEFSGLVLDQVGKNVQAGICCAAVSQATDGSVLGAMTYYVNDPLVGKYSVGLMAIDPLHLPGSPGTGQLRGIGTGLVAALALKLLKRGATRIDLHPLDDAARRFWTRRGFKDCVGSLCVEGPVEIHRLIASCDVQPDCPADGDCVSCGTRDSIRGTFPRAYARML